MKRFIFDYGLNVLISLVVLFLAGILWGQVSNAYYTFAPLTHFYESIGMSAEDACIEEGYHKVQSVRFVKQTDSGYPATVIREMFLVDADERIKVYAETAEAFVEVIPDGITSRRQRLPEDIEPGFYQWELAPTIIINGVSRQAPLITSNVFEVKHCIPTVQLKQ